MSVEGCKYELGIQASDWESLEFPVEFLVGRWAVKLELANSGGMIVASMSPQVPGELEPRMIVYHVQDIEDLNEWMQGCEVTKYPQFRNIEISVRRG